MKNLTIKMTFQLQNMAFCTFLIEDNSLASNSEFHCMQIVSCMSAQCYVVGVGVARGGGVPTEENISVIVIVIVCWRAILKGLAAS